jgi:2-polyprenyl-6-methoxyphenol hydroxylase-like FAD-dependent oxidoreductase
VPSRARCGSTALRSAAHIDTRRLTFLDEGGAPIVSLEPQAVVGGAEGRDIEVRRGDLAAALYDATRDDVTYRFGDSIEALDEDADGVEVTFRSGLRRRFDLVIGADGLHSRTRALAFGPEEQFHRYLGYCFAGFTMPNPLGLSHEGVMWNAPGRAAALYAVGNHPQVHGFLNFALPEPPFAAFRDPAAQRELVAAVFADDGWEVPDMVRAMRTADDLFFDVISQIRMPAWSRGRVALVGDAAACPTPLTGLGTSVALVQAYVLAGELAKARGDHRAAFESYEALARPYVTTAQQLPPGGVNGYAPRSAVAIRLRTASMRAMTHWPMRPILERQFAKAGDIALPDYTTCQAG